MLVSADVTPTAVLMTPAAIEANFDLLNTDVSVDAASEAVCNMASCS